MWSFLQDRVADMIRPYTPDDIDQVLGLLEALRRRSPYRVVKPDWPTIVQVVTTAAAKRTGLVLVAEHDGKITGLLIALATTLWWADPKFGARTASDIIFYSLRMGDGKRLLQRMISWAWSIPRVVRVECAVSSGEEASKVVPLYLAAGFHLNGTLLVANNPRYQAALDGIEEAA